MDYADYLRGVKEKKENPDASPSSVVMELRAGAGGNEASIFAHDLKNMYQKYAEHRGWKARSIDDLTLEIAGVDAYDALRYETGVHRVQRVPLTEKSGRIQDRKRVVEGKRVDLG